jgi:hypothetical protein
VGALLRSLCGSRTAAGQVRFIAERRRYNSRLYPTAGGFLLGD